jgi:ATP-dependent protease ClpP protease subunit
MSADDAKAYGLVDGIVANRGDTVVEAAKQPAMAG